ncbi:unnamed protein product [Ixodes persulcatus]
MEKVTNHVYWCAAIGNGDGQVVLDAWKTITRHIINVHDGHEGSLSRCMHPYRKFHQVVAQCRWVLSRNCSEAEMTTNRCRFSFLA